MTASHCQTNKRQQQKNQKVFLEHVTSDLHFQAIQTQVVHRWDGTREKTE